MSIRRGRTTPFHFAARDGDVETIRALIDSVDLEARDIRGWTALHLAVRRGQEAVVDLLLGRADLQARDPRDWTMLHFAMEFAREPIVRRIIDELDVNAVTGDDGSSALHMAAWHGSTSLASLLVDRGASIDPIDNEDRTPLDIAAERDYAELAVLLLDNGADPNRRQKDGASMPIHIAALEQSPEVLAFLVARGADIEARDASGNTPLHLAADLYHNRVDGPSSLGWLIANGASRTPRNHRGWTPLEHALIQRADEAALALAAVTDLNAASGDVWTPLGIAILRSRAKIADALLACGARADARLDGHALVVVAAALGRQNVVAMLGQRTGPPGDISSDIAAFWTAAPRWFDRLTGPDFFEMPAGAYRQMIEGLVKARPDTFDAFEIARSDLLSDLDLPWSNPFDAWEDELD